LPLGSLAQSGTSLTSSAGSKLPAWCLGSGISLENPLN
jgi:hypothetical protein